MHERRQSMGDAARRRAAMVLAQARALLTASRASCLAAIPLLQPAPQRCWRCCAGCHKRIESAAQPGSAKALAAHQPLR
jgi:hypothetical protein